MKTIITFFALCLFSLHSYAQAGCDISGPTSMELNDTATFSIPSSLAQCSNCYDWDVSNSNAQILTSDMSNSVQIKRVGDGSFTVTVTYINENGCDSCSIDFIALDEPDPCDYSFKINDVGIGFCDSIIMQVNIPPPTDAILYWTVTYTDGSTTVVVATGQNATIPMTPGIGIVSISIRSVLAGCPDYFTRIRFNTPIEVKDCDGGFDLSEDSKFTPYPNPVIETLRFEGNNLDTHQVAIYNVYGIEVLSKTILNQEISLMRLPAGTYFYVIYSGQKVVQKGSLIKQ